MPALVADYQKMMLKNRFKKIYSTYYQNLQKTVLIDFDGNVDCYARSDNYQVTYSDCPAFFEKFAQNLKIVKTCEGNALSGGCVPVLDDYMTPAGCGYFSETNMNNNNTAYVLANGTILVTYLNGARNVFLFDINGMKGPNRPGQDIWSTNVYLMVNSGGYKFSGNVLECLEDKGALFHNFVQLYE
jgi:hypothetical protein